MVNLQNTVKEIQENLISSVQPRTMGKEWEDIESNPKEVPFTQA